MLGSVTRGVVVSIGVCLLGCGNAAGPASQVPGAGGADDEHEPGGSAAQTSAGSPSSAGSTRVGGSGSAGAGDLVTEPVANAGAVCKQNPQCYPRPQDPEATTSTGPAGQGTKH